VLKSISETIIFDFVTSGAIEGFIFGSPATQAITNFHGKTSEPINPSISIL